MDLSRHLLQSGCNSLEVSSSSKYISKNTISIQNAPTVWPSKEGNDSCISNEVEKELYTTEITTSDQKIYERIQEKLYVAYQNLCPAIDEIISNATECAASSDMQTFEYSGDTMCSVTQDQYIGAIEASRLIQEIHNDVIRSDAINFDLLAGNINLPETEFIVQSVEQTVGTNQEQASPGASVTRIYIEKHVVEQLVELYNLLHGALQQLSQITKDKNVPVNHTNRVLKLPRTSNTQSPATESPENAILLNKLQEEYKDLSAAVDMLKSIVKETSGSIGDIKMLRKSLQDARKTKSDNSLVELEKSKRTTDASGARRCILECLVELAEVRKYLKNLDNSKEINAVSQISLTAEIKRECCSRKDVPHLHARLNGIPIVVKLNQEILDTILTSVGSSSSNISEDKRTEIDKCRDIKHNKPLGQPIKLISSDEKLPSNPAGKKRWTEALLAKLSNVKFQKQKNLIETKIYLKKPQSFTQVVGEMIPIQNQSYQSLESFLDNQQSDQMEINNLSNHEDCINRQNYAANEHCLPTKVNKIMKVPTSKIVKKKSKHKVSKSGCSPTKLLKMGCFSEKYAAIDHQITFQQVQPIPKRSINNITEKIDVRGVRKRMNKLYDKESSENMNVTCYESDYKLITDYRSIATVGTPNILTINRETRGESRKLDVALKNGHIEDRHLRNSNSKQQNRIISSNTFYKNGENNNSNSSFMGKVKQSIAKFTDKIALKITDSVPEEINYLNTLIIDEIKKQDIIKLFNANLDNSSKPAQPLHRSQDQETNTTLPGNQVDTFLTKISSKANFNLNTLKCYKHQMRKDSQTCFESSTTSKLPANKEDTDESATLTSVSMLNIPYSVSVASIPDINNKEDKARLNSKFTTRNTLSQNEGIFYPSRNVNKLEELGIQTTSNSSLTAKSSKTVLIKRTHLPYKVSLGSLPKDVYNKAPDSKYDNFNTCYSKLNYYSNLETNFKTTPKNTYEVRYFELKSNFQPEGKSIQSANGKTSEKKDKNTSTSDFDSVAGHIRSPEYSNYLPPWGQSFEVRVFEYGNRDSDTDIPMAMSSSRKDPTHRVSKSKYYSYPDEEDYARNAKRKSLGSERRPGDDYQKLVNRRPVERRPEPARDAPHVHGESRLGLEPWAPFSISDTSLPGLRGTKNKNPDLPEISEKASSQGQPRNRNFENASQQGPSMFNEPVFPITNEDATRRNRFIREPRVNTPYNVIYDRSIDGSNLAPLNYPNCCRLVMHSVATDTEDLHCSERKNQKVVVDTSAAQCMKKQSSRIHCSAKCCQTESRHSQRPCSSQSQRSSTNAPVQSNIPNNPAHHHLKKNDNKREECALLDELCLCGYTSKCKGTCGPKNPSKSKNNQGSTPITLDNQTKEKTSCFKSFNNNPHVMYYLSEQRPVPSIRSNQGGNLMQRVQNCNTSSNLPCLNEAYTASENAYGSTLGASSYNSKGYPIVLQNKQEKTVVHQENIIQYCIEQKTDNNTIPIQQTFNKSVEKCPKSQIDKYYILCLPNETSSSHENGELINQKDSITYKCQGLKTQHENKYENVSVLLNSHLNSSNKRDKSIGINKKLLTVGTSADQLVVEKCDDSTIYVFQTKSKLESNKNTTEEEKKIRLTEYDENLPETDTPTNEKITKSKDNNSSHWLTNQKNSNRLFFQVPQQNMSEDKISNKKSKHVNKKVKSFKDNRCNNVHSTHQTKEAPIKKLSKDSQYCSIGINTDSVNESASEETTCQSYSDISNFPDDAELSPEPVKEELIIPVLMNGENSPYNISKKIIETEENANKGGCIKKENYDDTQSKMKNISYSCLHKNSCDSETVQANTSYVNDNLVCKDISKYSIIPSQLVSTTQSASVPLHSIISRDRLKRKHHSTGLCIDSCCKATQSPPVIYRSKISDFIKKSMPRYQFPKNPLNDNYSLVNQQVYSLMENKDNLKNNFKTVANKHDGDDGQASIIEKCILLNQQSNSVRKTTQNSPSIEQKEASVQCSDGRKNIEDRANKKQLLDFSIEMKSKNNLCKHYKAFTNEHVSTNNNMKATIPEKGSSIVHSKPSIPLNNNNNEGFSEMYKSRLFTCNSFLTLPIQFHNKNPPFSQNSFWIPPDYDESEFNVYASDSKLSNYISFKNNSSHNISAESSQVSNENEVEFVCNAIKNKALNRHLADKNVMSPRAEPAKVTLATRIVPVALAASQEEYQKVSSGNIMPVALASSHEEHKNVSSITPIQTSSNDIQFSFDAMFHQGSAYETQNNLNDEVVSSMKYIDNSESVSNKDVSNGNQTNCSSKMFTCSDTNNLDKNQDEVYWALTKVKTHHDGTQDFEILDATPISAGHFLIPTGNSIVIVENQHSRSAGCSNKVDEKRRCAL